MKRETTALALSSVCVLVGCATLPAKIEYTVRPASQKSDCGPPAGYYANLNAHDPTGKVTVAGFIQVDHETADTDPHWISQSEVVVQGLREWPFASLWGFVAPAVPDKVYIAVRYGLKASQGNPVAVPGAANPPIAFELTTAGPRQLTVSVGGGARTISAPQFDVVPANLTCTSGHATAIPTEP